MEGHAAVMIPCGAHIPSVYCSLGIVAWLSLFLLLSVPFDILVLLVSRSSAVGLVFFVSYSLVSFLLRFLVASHSLQVNVYSFLLLFSVLGISCVVSL